MQAGCLDSRLINEVLEAPSEFIRFLNSRSEIYQVLKSAARFEAERLFSAEAGVPVSFGPFGIIIFPFFRMGAVDSRNLFDIDELLLFNFYWKNRDIYRNFLDIGANIGLHTLIALRCGFNVRSFEPDPVHFARLTETLMHNPCSLTPDIYQAALSISTGRRQFCRVKGNTTGSHLAGAKASPYGELEYFDVDVENALLHIQWADLVKMDVEGHEAAIICACDAALFNTTDIIAEVGTAENASLIFEHLSLLGVNMFPQKKNWNKATSLEDVPCNYKEGSILISKKRQVF